MAVPVSIQSGKGTYIEDADFQMAVISASKNQHVMSCPHTPPLSTSDGDSSGVWTPDNVDLLVPSQRKILKSMQCTSIANDCSMSDAQSLFAGAAWLLEL